MSKTNIGLLEYARSKIGTPYVYGAKMEVLTKAKYDWLKKTYGSMVWDSDVKKVGKVCCDCSGLISAYSGVVLGSSQMKERAKTINPISTIKNAPLGALVWMQGHIGIYSGMTNGVPYYVAEDGSAYGCRETKLSNNKFTHWFLCADILYVEEKKIETYPVSKENISKLTELGVMTSPTYWVGVNLQYLDELCSNAIPKMDKGIDNGITDFKTALKLLVDKKVIVSPDYWMDRVSSGKIKYLDSLIINIANRIK